MPALVVESSRIALVYPGGEEARRAADPDRSRFAPLFRAFAARGVSAVPAIYHDDWSTAVRDQLRRMDAALVWVNPIEDGRDRSILDAMLREVADAGTFVSAHPDIILKLGTKEVVHETRALGWGSETYLYRTHDELRRELPLRLAQGKARVLKQYRGNGGTGVWKVERASGTRLRVRHAARGSVEEEIAFDAFMERCAPYFDADGRMLDQPYQDRLPEGMIRCYLVHDRVAGFGHQAVNALFPAPPGAPASKAPEPGPRLYHPPTVPEFQILKERLEREWVPEAQRLLAIETHQLPVLWDADFLLGPKDERGDDSYVLCEINVSSVAPYPESAIPFIVDATIARAREARDAHKERPR